MKKLRICLSFILLFNIIASLFCSGVVYAGAGDELSNVVIPYASLCNDYKDAQIEELKRQKENMREQFEKRCKEYETRMAFLRDQIEKKDDRMDRKDEIIEKLLDQVLICGHCPVGKDK